MQPATTVWLTTPRLRVVQLGPEHAGEQLAYHLRNRERLARFEPPRPPGFFTRDFWAWRLAQNQDDTVSDLSLRLQLVPPAREPLTVLGQIGITEIVRGGMHQGSLGYSIDGDMEGRGLMTEALTELIPAVFRKLALHRLQAAYLPGNSRSARLLERVQFQVEGLARAYLYVDGAWRDHLIAARIHHELRRPGLLLEGAEP